MAKTPAVEHPTNNSKKIPGAALWLGLGGLIPFFVSAACLWLRDTIDHFEAATALVAYAAVILSFLGGINWGAALAEPDGRDLPKRLFWSIVPSLVGWTALLVQALFNHEVALIILLVAFVLQYLSDSRAVSMGRFPVWFGRLRLILTCGVVLALAAGLLGLVTS